ncbi:hypothetical protein [Amycolatopsis sp. WAC 04182]|uniref:hypothetical protein n=1 Tax=Amycolatopsis sp. WAC 04182 TaxID=2203198 RepID=UPI000F7BA3ED|nr:hypothetical protein [Amycolatopsis sp. WAC 04182]
MARKKDRTRGSGSRSGSGWQRILGFFALALITLVLATLTVVVGVQEPPNKLAASIMQGMTLLFGVLTAHVYGLLSAKNAAKEMVRLHARKSIRRIVNLQQALFRHDQKHSSYLDELQEALVDDEAGKSYVDFTQVKWAIGTLQQLTQELQATCRDSLEDWKDIAPEELESESGVTLKEEPNA